MSNIILCAVTLVVSFSGVILFYKMFGKIGLFVWLSIAAIIANIQTVKLVDIFGLETSLGTILYGSTFLATDIINEKYGKKEAKKTVYLGFLVMTFFTVLMYIALLYKPSSSDFASESLDLIFTLNIRITIASILGFVVSQFMDTSIYNKLKNKSQHLWLRNNVSTIISQLFDTIIFVLITYIGEIELSVIINIAITMYLFKIIVAILDTPFMYLSKKVKYNKEENL